MVTRSNTRSKASAEMPAHNSNSKIFGRVDLLDQSGEVTQSWLIDSQSCQVGSAAHTKIRIDRLAPIHASFVFGRRNTLVKCLQGVMTVGAKNVREYLIDEPTTIHLAGAALIVFPTAFVRSSLEHSGNIATQESHKLLDQSSEAATPSNPVDWVDSSVNAVSSEVLQAALVNSTVSAVQQSLEPLQTALTALTNKWDQLLISTKTPTPDIAVEIDRRFEQIEQQIPQLSSELGEMNGRLARSLDSTNNSMASMANEIRERFDFISQRFDQKDDTREASIDSTLSLLAEQLKQIQERLEAAPQSTPVIDRLESAHNLQQFQSLELPQYFEPADQDSYSASYTSNVSYEEPDYDNQYVDQVVESEPENVTWEAASHYQSQPENYQSTDEGEAEYEQHSDQGYYASDESGESGYEAAAYENSDVEQADSESESDYESSEQHYYSQDQGETYRTVDASEYDEPTGQNYFEQSDSSVVGHEEPRYEEQYVEQDQAGFQSSYESHQSEDYSREQVSDYQANYETYSEEPLGQSEPDAGYQAEYVSDYQPQAERSADYSEYSHNADDAEASPYVDQHDESVDYHPVADSDLLSQAQDSDYNPTEYGYRYDSQVSDETVEPTSEGMDCSTELKPSTASYTPIARDFSDAQEDFSSDYAAMSEQDYPEQPVGKSELPAWFTKDEDEAGIGGDDSSQYDDVESELDSAVYEPIRHHEHSGFDEADVSDDLSADDEPATGEVQDDESEFKHHSRSYDELPESGNYALPDEVEVEVEEDSASAPSALSQDIDESNGSEELVDDEESVEQYMQRLLARVKGGDTVGVKPAPVKTIAASPTPAPLPTPTSKAKESALLAKSLMDSQEYAHRALSDEEYTPRSAAPESSLNLEAMRTLANETARTALAKSTHKPASKENNFGKLGISVFGFLVGTVILLVNGITMNVAFLGMICGYLIFLIWGFEATQNVSLTTKRN